MRLYDVCVVGGGSAGIMAALRAVLNNDSVLLFPGTRKDRNRSRERWVKKVENMPAHFDYKRGIDQPSIETIKWIENSIFYENLSFMKGLGVTSIVKENDVFKIIDNEGSSYQSTYVILATGVMDVQPKMNDSIRDILPYANKQTADYCLRCDGHHVHGKELAIIGHNDVAAWTAIILHERYKCPNISIITHGKKTEFKESSQKLLDLYKIDVYDGELVQIVGDVRSGALEGFTLSCGSFVPAEFSFISLGMIVYNELALSLGAKVDDRGFVLGDEAGETNVPGLFVAGDLRAGRKKQIYTAWDMAVDSADRVNRYVRAAKREKLLGNN